MVAKTKSFRLNTSSIFGVNTIASKDDPEYDVSFGDFNDFLQIAKQERERHNA